MERKTKQTSEMEIVRSRDRGKDILVRENKRERQRKRGR